MHCHDLPTATALSLVMVVLAFDCDYNRSTTEDKVGRDMLEIAKRHYTWNIVAMQYFELFGE